MKPRTFLIVLLLSLFAGFASADVSKKQAIVGTWSMADGDLTGSFTFSANGTVKMKSQKKSMNRSATGEGKYEWIDDSTLKLQVIFDRAPREMTMKVVKLDAKSLVVTDERRGETITFKRTK